MFDDGLSNKFILRRSCMPLYIYIKTSKLSSVIIKGSGIYTRVIQNNEIQSLIRWLILEGSCYQQMFKLFNLDLQKGKKNKFILSRENTNIELYTSRCLLNLCLLRQIGRWCLNKYEFERRYRENRLRVCFNSF